MKRVLRWAGWTFAGLVGLVLVAVAIGLFLPESHTATATRVVGGSPIEVWDAITDVERFTTWRPGLDEAERLPDRDGLPVWREAGRTGSMTLQVTEFDPPRRLVTRIADEGLPFGGTWTYEVEEAEGGTRVTLTEDGEIYNPFFRFVSRYVLGYDATMNAYLDGLEERMADLGPGEEGGTS